MLKEVNRLIFDPARFDELVCERRGGRLDWTDVCGLAWLS